MKTAEPTFAQRSAYTRAAMPRLVAEAVTAGTHSANWSVVCDGCRRWCDGIYHVTVDRKKLGACCAPRLIGGPNV